LDVCTVHLVQFIIQSNKCTYIYIYINNILYIVSTPTCFNASASSSGSLILIKINLNDFCNFSKVEG